MLKLKGLKTFRGMEGHGFNATLLLNDKPVALAVDEGCGGCVWFEYEGKTPETRKANEAALKAYVESLPKEKCPEDAEDWMRSLYDANGYRAQDLETIVSRLVDDTLNERDLARHKKTSVCFTVPGQPKGEYYRIKHGGDVPRIMAHIAKKYPAYTVL